MSYQLRNRIIETNYYKENDKTFVKIAQLLIMVIQRRLNGENAKILLNNKDDTTATESTIDLKLSKTEVQNSSDDNKNNQTYEVESNTKDSESINNLNSFLNMTERELDQSILQRDTFFNRIVEDDCSSTRSSDTDDSDFDVIFDVDLAIFS